MDIRASSRRTALAFALLLVGCAASSYQAGLVTYQQDDFTADALIEGGVAILPIVAGQGVEGYRRPFGASVDAEVENHASGAAFLRWEETMDRINEYGVAAEYNDAIITYRETSIIDRTVVQQLGDATGLRYLLFIQLDPPEHEKGFKGGLSPGYRRVESIGVSAFAQVWDTVSGDVVWEGNATAGITERTELARIKSSERDPNIYSARVADELVTKLFDRTLVVNQ